MEYAVQKLVEKTTNNTLCSQKGVIRFQNFANDYIEIEEPL